MKRCLLIFLLISCSLFEKGTRRISSENSFQALQALSEHIEELSIDEKISYLHEVEQYTIYSKDSISTQKKARPLFIKIFKKLRQESNDLLVRKNIITKARYEENEYGQLRNLDLPNNIKYASRYNGDPQKKEVESLLKQSFEKNTFLDAFNSEKENCKTYKHLYLNDAIEVLLLSSSFSYNKFSDLIEAEHLSPSLEDKKNFFIDVQRGAWAFRRLSALSKDQKLESCRVEERVLQNEAQLRFDYLFNYDLVKKRPLGFAIGMCGRPMNSHYIDPLIESKKREFPTVWDQDRLQSFERLKDQLDFLITPEVNN